MASTFSKILAAKMKDLNLTVRVASEMAGVSPSTLQDWRAGSPPKDYAAVKRLANALGVSLSYILTGEEDAHSQDRDIAEVFPDNESVFDGYLKVKIERMIPRKPKK